MAMERGTEITIDWENGQEDNVVHMMYGSYI